VRPQDHHFPSSTHDICWGVRRCFDARLSVVAGPAGSCKFVVPINLVSSRSRLLRTCILLCLDSHHQLLVESLISAISAISAIKTKTPRTGNRFRFGDPILGSGQRAGGGQAVGSRTHLAIFLAPLASENSTMDGYMYGSTEYLHVFNITSADALWALVSHIAARQDLVYDGRAHASRHPTNPQVPSLILIFMLLFFFPS
jgi:hypothetical protein